MPGAGAAGWSAPETIATGADGGPRLAMTQRGDALVVFRRGDELSYARARRGGAFSAPAAIPGADAGAILDEDDFLLEGDEDGNAVVAWREFVLSYSEPDICCNYLRAAAVRAGGPFGHATRLPSRDDVAAYDVDLDPLGAAAVAWNDGLSTRLATALDFTTFGGFRTAVGNCGYGAVALTAYPGVEDLVFTCEPRGALRARTLRADGAGGARTVAPGGPYAAALVASDAAFDQLGAWWEETFPLGPVRAGVRRTGAFRDVRTLGRSTGRSALVPTEVAAAPRGFGIVALHRFETSDGDPIRVLAATRRRGAGFGRAVPLPRSAALAAPAGAIGDRGHAAVAWPALAGDRIVVARGGALGARHGVVLEPPLTEREREECDGYGKGCPATDVGVDRRGNVLVVWRDHDAIRIARYAAP